MENDHNKKRIQVIIGELTLGEPVPDQPTEGHAQPNPRVVRWSKTHRIEEVPIPGFRDKTLRTSGETLWHLEIITRTLRKTTTALMFSIVNDPGPYYIQTAPMSLWMYLVDGSGEQVEGEDDDIYLWNLRFTECRD